MNRAKNAGKDRRKTGRKVLAAVLAPVLILTLAASIFSGSLGQVQAADITKTADESTMGSYSAMLGDNQSTRYNGRVWSDKSVSTGNVVFDGSAGRQEVDIGDSDFLTTYSLLGTSVKVEGKQPTDTVFILDFSTSMTWGYEEEGQSVAKEDSRIQALVEAVNSSIDTLIKANPENRIAIITFNGSAGQLSGLNSGKKVLENVTDGNYLEITDYDYTQGKDGGTATVKYNYNGNTVSTGSGTNIQAGLFKGMKLLADNDDTTYTTTDGHEVTRIPNVVLMSDGAPTTFSSAEDAKYYVNTDEEVCTGKITNDTEDLDSSKTVQSGSWWASSSGEEIGSGNNEDPDSADGFMTLLTAAYFKKAISENYYGNDSQEKQANIYTVGFGTDVQSEAMVAMANLVLDPGKYLDQTTKFEKVDAVKEAWEEYQEDKEPIVSAPIGHGNTKLFVDYQVSHPDDPSDDPESLIYPTESFSATDADDLNNIFQSITNMITSEAEVPTEITGNDPVQDGFITYEDPIGQYMQVDDVPAVMYAGERFDRDNVNVSESGDVITKTYTFVNKDGETEIDSPIYGPQDISEIQITVEQDADGNQTLKVQVPASAIPLRVNTITLDGSGNVESNIDNGALPLRVLYRVSLRDDVTDENGNINAAALDQDYIEDNLTTVTDQNGKSIKKINFYANSYSQRTEGVSDTRTMGDASVTFKPASTNPFYFVQENTPLYVNGTEGVIGEGGDEGTPATGTIDSDTTYYFTISYYEGQKTVKRVIARDGATLQNFAENTGDNGQLELQKGSPRLGNLTEIVADKGSNETGTADTSRYPTFNSTDPTKGEFVIYLGNNGLLQLDAPASLTIAKEVTAEAGVTAPDETFTFGVNIPDKADTTVTAVKHTPGKADEQVSLEFDSDGNGQVVTRENGQKVLSDITLKADETLEIPVTVNTGYQVWETDIPDGFMLSDAHTSQNGTGSFNKAEKKVSGTLSNEDLTVTFINHYDTFVTLDGSSYLKVSKKLEGRQWDSDDRFLFTLTAENSKDASGGTIDASKVPMPSDASGTSASVTLTKDKTAGAFGNITYTDPGVYKYTITENSGSEGGITYSKAVYQVEVTVTDTGKGVLHADAVMTKVQDDSGDSLESPAVAVDNTAGFTNTYIPTGTVQITEKDFDLTKVLTGKAWDTDSFTFELTALGGKSSSQLSDYDIAAKDVPMPANTKVTVNAPDGKTQSGDDSAAFGFGTIEYTKPGIYYYQVNEIKGNNAGMTYSENTATVTVTVEDNLHGGYTAFVNTENGTFTNKYSTELDYSAKGGLTVVKKLTGHDMEKFSFLVKPADQASADKADIRLSGKTYQNAAGASMDLTGTSTAEIDVLESMKFTQADAGKTYTYTITEQSGTEKGYTYDDTVYTVKITAADDGNGILTVNTQINGSNGVQENYTYSNVKDSPEDTAAVTFSNSYGASGELGGKGNVNISAEKILTGRDMVQGEFHFSVTDKNGKEVASGTNSAASDGQAGSVDFTTITYTKDSLISDAAQGTAIYSSENGKDTYTYQYTVSENADSLPDGISQEAGKFVINVKVTDNNDGTLSTAVSYPQGSNNILTFRNSYGTSAESVLNITGEKVLKVASGNNAPDITGKYTFTLTGSDGAPMPKVTEVTNDAGGNISFGDIIYTMENVFGDEAGQNGTERTKTFTYTVTESGIVPGVVNDKQAAKTFDVTVTDKGNGTLEVKTDNTGMLFVFTNTYSVKETDPSAPADSGITFTKDLTGRKMKDGEFHFLMTDEDGNTVSDGYNRADGSITFDGIRFDTPGTYSYQICEENGALGGITYDTEVYTAVANVTDNGNGTLHVSWSVTDGSGKSVVDIVFHNTYKTSGVTDVTLGAAKVLKGRELKDGEFTFLLKDNSGNVISQALNNADGAVSFESLSFDETGTYQFTISEEKGNEKGIVYDDSVYEVTITVTDDGNGNLDASIDYNGKDPVFTNEYKDTETPETSETPDVPDSEITDNGTQDSQDPQVPAEEEASVGSSAPTTGDSRTAAPLAVFAAAAAGMIAAGTALAYRRKREKR